MALWFYFQLLFAHGCLYLSSTYFWVLVYKCRLQQPRYPSCVYVLLVPLNRAWPICVCLLETNHIRNLCCYNSPRLMCVQSRLTISFFISRRVGNKGKCALDMECTTAPGTHKISAYHHVHTLWL